jgi:hypothetical protein
LKLISNELPAPLRVVRMNRPSRPPTKNPALSGVDGQESGNVAGLQTAADQSATFHFNSVAKRPAQSGASERTLPKERLPADKLLAR